ncbi:hypothetical protein ETR_01211 [Erwinia tracheiphila PSU-1]|nr:hypothetical protein ETR_01211 [Erwinia tracheiphila PSU-1]
MCFNSPKCVFRSDKIKLSESRRQEKTGYSDGKFKKILIVNKRKTPNLIIYLPLQCYRILIMLAHPSRYFPVNLLTGGYQAQKDASKENSTCD